MPHFHADPSVVKTAGPRGTTTRRRGTKSIHGPEGSYIAQVKEELMARGPVTRFVVMVTTRVPAYDGTREIQMGNRYETRDDAETELARWPTGKQGGGRVEFGSGFGWTQPWVVVSARVVEIVSEFVWQNGRPVEQVRVVG